VTPPAPNPRVPQPVQVQGREVLVVGAARSGLAAARLLCRLGAQVTLADAKPANQLAEARAEVERLGARLAPQVVDLSSLPRPELAVLSPGVPPSAPIYQDLQRHGVPVLGELELAWQFCPATVIAVAGTNGKGTTCRLAAAMCEGAGLPTALAGNIGQPLAAIVDRLSPAHVVVLEVSSFQLMSTVTFAPHVAAVLNITPDHLDWHRDWEEYVAAKRRIFACQRPEDLALVVIDDPGAAALQEAVRCQLARVSLTQAAEVGWEDGSVVLRLPGRPCQTIAVPELGEWALGHRLDALVAAAAACFVGATGDAVRTAVAAYHHPPHLLTVVAEHGGVRYVDDSKATNVAAAVGDLAQLAARSPVVVITGGQDKGADLTPWAQALRQQAKAVVTIGQTGPKLAAMLAGRPVSSAASMQEAVREASRWAEPGDTVALIPAASSFDMFADYAERGEQFAAAVAKLAQTP
jgi:UDP-N-acetylmuramoylalanine--D-glutamate ligase